VPIDKELHETMKISVAGTNKKGKKNERISFRMVLPMVDQHNFEMNKEVLELEKTFQLM
jgi:hypothetical protein